MNSSELNRGKAFRSTSAKPQGYQSQNSKPQANKRSRKMNRTSTEKNESSFGKAVMRNNRLLTAPNEGVSRLLPAKSVKEPEEIFQENFHLKQAMHKLTGQLHLQRGKVEMQKKKNYKYVKMLDREFEKEFYWDKNNSKSHLIAGIKRQYEKIKEDYQDKCHECDLLRRNISHTQIQELKIYCETLVEENKFLIDNYESRNPENKESNLMFRSKNLTKGQQQSESISWLLQQEQKRTSYLEEKQEIAQLKIEGLQGILTEKDRKVEFLEKLMIEKDNCTHHSLRAVKKLEREKTELFKKCQHLTKTLQETQQNTQSRLQNLRESEGKKSEIERTIYEKNMAEKGKKISQLQKEISYLSTLLSYWKPLDEIDRDCTEGNFEQPRKESLSPWGNQVTKKPQERISSPNSSSQQLNIPKERTEAGEQLLMDESEVFPLEVRVRKTAAQRQSDTAIKTRKVNPSSIEHLRDTLKYRFLGYQISIEKIKEYLDYRPVGKPDEWENQYISMREMKKVLLEYPFSMSEDNAYLMSRYIVEDCTEEYIYCHEDNEIDRAIAKSIIKAFVGEYEVPHQEKAQKEWREVKKTYSQNMQLALHSLAPSGHISAEKFLELVYSLGIEMTQPTQEWCVGKMLIGSKSLAELSYDLLFDQAQRIQ